MVGTPKHLSQLRRIEASLQVDCRACGDRRRHDPDALSLSLSRGGGSDIWSELPRQLPCPACGSPDVRVLPVPYGIRASRDQKLITLALRVLDEAAYLSSSQAVDSVQVRLALRVLLPYVADRGGLLAFWDAALQPPTAPGSACRLPYYRIQKALRDAGWHAVVPQFEI